MNVLDWIDTYRKLRTLNVDPFHARRFAKMKARFRELEARGLVRVAMVYDPEPYDMSYLETWGLTERQLAHEREKTANLIEREGVWGMIPQARLRKTDKWEDGQGVWSCLGYEPEDLEAEGIPDALDVFDSLVEATSSELEERPTYARVV